MGSPAYRIPCARGKGALSRVLDDLPEAREMGEAGRAALASTYQAAVELSGFNRPMGRRKPRQTAKQALRADGALCVTFVNSARRGPLETCPGSQLPLSSSKRTNAMILARLSSF